MPADIKTNLIHRYTNDRLRTQLDGYTFARKPPFSIAVSSGPALEGQKTSAGTAISHTLIIFIDLVTGLACVVSRALEGLIYVHAVNRRILPGSGKVSQNHIIS